MPDVAWSRVIAEAKGNPLALAELAALARDAGTVDVAVSSHRPLTLRLEEAFAARG
jgi:hypothetical protein